MLPGIAAYSSRCKLAAAAPPFDPRVPQQPGHNVVPAPQGGNHERCMSTAVLHVNVDPGHASGIGSPGDDGLHYSQLSRGSESMKRSIPIMVQRVGTELQTRQELSDDGSGGGVEEARAPLSVHHTGVCAWLAQEQGRDSRMGPEGRPE